MNLRFYLAVNLVSAALCAVACAVAFVSGLIGTSILSLVLAVAQAALARVTYKMILKESDVQ